MGGGVSVVLLIGRAVVASCVSKSYGLSQRADSTTKSVIHVLNLDHSTAVQWHLLEPGNDIAVVDRDAVASPLSDRATT